MRRVLHIFCWMVAIALAGCVQELPTRPSYGIDLKVSVDAAGLTKATVLGDAAYNENLISWVDLYLYPGDNDLDVVPLTHVRMVSGKNDQDNFRVSVAPPSEVTEITVYAVANCPETLADNLRLSDLAAHISKADFDTPNKHKMDRFLMAGSVVLTIDRDSEPLASGTLLLKRLASKLTVSVHVAESVELNPHEVWVPMLEGMEIYMMDAVKKVKLGGVDEDDDPEKYFYYGKSVGQENRKRFAWMNNRVDPAVLTPYVGKENRGTEQDPRWYYDTYPMYMYPQTWVEGEGSSNNKDREPYLKLVVPWYREEYESTDPEQDIHIFPTQKQCYYKIVFPRELDRFTENTLYHMDINVSLLGALTDENPLEITGTCYIMYWQEKEMKIMQAEVGKARYLSVDTTWTLNNLNELDIPVVSSHQVEITDVVASRPYYGLKDHGATVGSGTVVGRKSDHGDRYLDYSSTASTEKWLKINDAGTAIEFRHTLDNRYTQPEFDYSPYTISFTVHHYDNPGYSKRITITQYPGIYIDRLYNSDIDVYSIPGHPNITEENNKYDLGLTYWGYVFVDGGAYKYNLPGYENAFTFVPGQAQIRVAKSSSTDPFFKLPSTKEKKEYQWRTVWYTGGSNELYRIGISVLPDDAKLTITENNQEKEYHFVIGDPRRSVQEIPEYEYVPPEGALLNIPQTDFAQAPAIYGEAYRTLKWYYPTEESDRTLNMVSPGFRICSKFGGIEYGGEGGLSDISFEYAKYRCAAYQEDGFPAGRWRLPTLAEVSFVAQLSVNGTITPVFNDKGYYWSANGSIQIDNKKVKKVSRDYALLRCVYDTWYWGDDQTEYDEWRVRVYRASGRELRNMFVWGDKPR